MFSPPEHIVIWTPRGLRAALARCGFDVARVRTTGFNPYEVYRRLRPAKAGAPAMSRNDAAFALNAQLSRSRGRRLVKDAINTGLNAFKLGDDIKIWAVPSASQAEGRRR